MDKLEKQLTNKEAQFKEMTAQLMAHLNKINKLTELIEGAKEENSRLNSQFAVKSEELEKILKEKSELYEILQGYENPSFNQENTIEKNLEIQESQEKKEVNEIHELIEESKEEKLEENDEAKEEAYISNEIDITAELEKLGIVDLVKKY